MSTLLIKQSRLIQLREKYDVADENEQPIYQVKGTLVRIPKQVTISDMEGTQKALLTVKIVTLFPTLFVDIDGERVATIRKKFSPIKPKYEVEGPGLVVRGNILDMNFDVTKDGVLIGHVDKKWLTLRDIYALHVEEGQDEIMLLSIVLAISHARQMDRALSDTAG